LLALPERLHRLEELAVDLWWSWNDQAREMFRALDDQLWTFTSHNPVQLLHLLSAARVAEAAAEPSFLAHYDETIASFDAAHASGSSGTVWSLPCLRFGSLRSRMMTVRAWRSTSSTAMRQISPSRMAVSPRSKK